MAETLTPNNRREHWYSEIIDAIDAQGGGGGGGGVEILTMTVTENEWTLSKTYGEIEAIFFSGIPIYLLDTQYEDEGTVDRALYPVYGINRNDLGCGVVVWEYGGDNPWSFACNSPDDYPVIDWS